MPDAESSNLKAHLKQLQSSLAQADVDDELRLLLADLDGDIRVLLEQRSAEVVPPQLPPADPANLAERTQEISARFAAQHPKLEPTLRELGNMLANMGI